MPLAMKNLLLSSVFLLLLISCKLGHYGNLVPRSENSNMPPASIFGDNFESFLFKTNITVYGKNYSGLLVTKQMHPNDYRVIFTTELGMKLFDFEFKDTTFTMHYCVPQFNRPKLLQTIQHDIEVLLMNNLKDKKTIDLKPKKKKNAIKQLLPLTKKIEMNTHQNYYFYNQADEIYKIEKAKKKIKKTTFTLNNYENNFPNNIIIQHHDIKLKIELNKLKKE